MQLCTLFRSKKAKQLNIPVSDCFGFESKNSFLKAFSPSASSPNCHDSSIKPGDRAQGRWPQLGCFS